MMKGRRDEPDGPTGDEEAVGQPAPDFRYKLLNTPTVDGRLNTEILERAIKGHVATQLAGNEALSGTSGADEVAGIDPRHLLEALLVSDQAFLDTVVPTLLARSVTLPVFHRAIVRPVAEMLGEMWCEDEIDFVQVEIISMRLRLMCNQLVNRRMAGRTPWLEDERRRVLLAHTGGDRHTLGFSLAEAFFRDAGWFVSGGVELEPSEDYYDILRAEHFWLVALAFSRDDACDVSEIIARTRRASMNRSIKVCFGGVAVSANPDRYRALGADIVAINAPAAVQQAERMLAGSPVH